MKPVKGRLKECRWARGREGLPNRLGMPAGFLSGILLDECLLFVIYSIARVRVQRGISPNQELGPVGNANQYYSLIDRQERVLA